MTRKTWPPGCCPSPAVLYHRPPRPTSRGPALSVIAGPVPVVPVIVKGPTVSKSKNSRRRPLPARAVRADSADGPAVVPALPVLPGLAGGDFRMGPALQSVVSAFHAPRPAAVWPAPGAVSALPRPAGISGRAVVPAPPVERLQRLTVDAAMAVMGAVEAFEALAAAHPGLAGVDEARLWFRVASMAMVSADDAARGRPSDWLPAG